LFVSVIFTPFSLQYSLKSWNEALVLAVEQTVALSNLQHPHPTLILCEGSHKGNAQ